MTPRIALDAMGGDHAPEQVVAGALTAARRLGVEVLLVGPHATVRVALGEDGDAPGIHVVDAADVIAMDEHIEAVRTKPQASINVGLRLVKDDAADAFVTAGNTGAALTGALLTLGRVRGISRPALATVVPTRDGLTMLLDVGANADSKPAHLVQFAHMGAATMERMYGIERPRVGLLSIGEEDTKGNQLTIEVNGALRASDLNFVGNVEAKELTNHAVDVAVMDGFTGNVLLKTAEGIAELFFDELKKAVKLTPWNMAAGLVLKGELRKTQRRLDYSEYGGAQLLGVDGVVFVAHGRSNARAIYNAVRAARDAVQTGIMAVMHEVAERVPARPVPGDGEPAAAGASTEGEA